MNGAIKPPSPAILAHLCTNAPPRLLVFIDAEEECDWTRFDASATSVSNIARQGHAQAIFDRFGVCPTYLVDYPVASQPEGYEPLRELFEQGRCDIGAHLHPWVNPPIMAPSATIAESYAGNLGPDLERGKLAVLTRTIERSFGRAPVVYRAGRYGAGASTARILVELGYRIDTSVLPQAHYSASGGPSYRGYGVEPYWLDRRAGLLELPISAAIIGYLAPWGTRLNGLVSARWSSRLKIPALMSRMGLMNRVRLSPEGQRLDEAIMLTRALMDQGVRLFVMTYHSSSLLPGAAPFVRNEADLKRFLGWIEEYLDFFMVRLGGRPALTAEIYAEARQELTGAVNC